MGFPVRRTRRSYVRPSAATPSGFLELSRIDRVAGLRHMVRSLHVFAPARAGEGPLPPAGVIRQALGEALVDYYPMAGRLVDGAEGPGGVRVECTGEGAWFVEAVAGCSLEDEYPLPVPDADLLPDDAPGVDPLHIPLLMQVTEFTCGGFVVGLISSHTITDGLGAGQFINAVADYARGLPKPRVSPMWARDLIPSPPGLLSGPPPSPRMFRFRHLTVDLSSDTVNKLKAQVFASTGQSCSTFDVVVATTWQARTRSLRLAEADPSARVSICFPVNVRRHLLRGGGAGGYYGNCTYPAVLGAASGAVEGAGVVGVVALVQEAKSRVPAEVARWAAGELAEDDPYELPFAYESLFVSDWTRLGFLEADYGWGTPAQVVPLAYHPFMPIALICAPPAPMTGFRIMTRCVEEEHFPLFKEEMMALQK